MKKVTVSGANEADVDAAIEEINLQRVSIPVRPEHIDYVCGTNDENLNYFI